MKDTLYGPPTKTFTVVLSNPTNATIQTPSATVTINNTVPAPTVSIADFSKTEGNSGTSLATTTITLSAASNVPATVSYTTADISAVAGVDYVSTSGTVTFAPGQTSATISIPIIGNTTPQANRTFAVNLSAPTGATIGKGQAIGTIVDDDAPVGLSADNISANQTTTPTTATFTIVLTEASGLPVSVQYATANGTAIAGTDYLSTQGTLTFAPGETSKTVTVTIEPATVAKAPTTFSLLLTNPVNTTITTPTVTATIQNTVTAPSLAIAPVMVEAPTTGTATALFNVTLSAPSGETVTVNYQTSNGTATAGTDYVAAQGTLTFAPGQTVQQIPVTVNGTMQLLPNRTFTVTLSGASDATIGTASATGTIVNSNLPHVATVSDASASTPPVGTTANEAFTVTLSNASDLTVTLQYATADITAKAGVDYVNTTGSLTFAPGQTTQTINVPILGQSVNKPNLTFALNLTSPQNATIGRAQGIGTIVSSVAEPSATITGTTVNDTAMTAPFTVTLSAASGQTITISYATQDGTAIAGTDYTATSGTLTFAPGVTSQTVNVPISKDTAFGPPSKTFTVVLSNPMNATIQTASATATINNTVPAPTVSIADFSKTEGNSGTSLATTTITLSAPSNVPATVSYATSDISAMAGVDYVATTGTVTFAPGQTSATISIPIIGNTTPQANRTFAVNLSAPTGATIGKGQAIGTIVDDDAAPGLSVGDITVTRTTAPTTASFTVMLSEASGLPITVQYQTSNGSATAGVDYSAVQGTLTFAPGVTQQTVTVPILGATVPQAPVTFTLALSNASNATITTSQATATIQTNIPLPSLTASDVTVTETMTSTVQAVFNVTLSAPSGVPITVQYQTANGTALANQDYLPTQGTLTFNPGQTVQTISVTVLPGTTPGPNKQFSVLLSGPTNASIADGMAVGTIVVPYVIPTVSVNDTTTTTGTVGSGHVALFTINLNQPSTLPVTVTYVTQDGTAVSGRDYLATQGTLTFAPGQTVQTVSVPVTGYNTQQPTKTFSLLLSGPSNATLGNARGTATITSDILPPSFSITDATITDPDSGTVNLPFVVSLSGPSGLPVSVQYSTADLTAMAGVNYIPQQGVLNFAPGVTTQQILVPIIGSLLNKATLQFTLNLSNPANATIADAQAIGTILDTHPFPTVTIGNATVAKPPSGAVLAGFTVTLSSASEQPVSVHYSTADGTGVANVDYVPTSGTLNFAPGQTTMTIPVAVLGSTTYSGDRTFLVQLDSPVHVTLGNLQGVGTIKETNPLPNLGINDVTVTEPAAGTTDARFYVALDRTSRMAISVNYTTANLSAHSGTDYVPVSGVLTFNPGETYKTIDVPVLGGLAEKATTQFAVVLSSPVDASIGRGVGLGTIVSANSTVVTTTSDSGPGSLRQAILTSNATPGVDTISFAIPGGGVQVIAVGSALPTITDPVNIDGRTQPGYGGSPLIMLDGGGSGGADGLRITAGNSSVIGLAIDAFGGAGIVLSNKGGNRILADYLGVEADGTTLRGNRNYGVYVSNTPNNVIGDGSTDGRNIISGNGISGVLISGSGASGNLVAGDYVGTNAQGNGAVPNGQNGVTIASAPLNNVSGNLISGNATNGVKIYGVGSTRNRVQRNAIGTNVPNGGFGILTDYLGPKDHNTTSPNTYGGNGFGALSSRVKTHRKGKHPL